eukprot:scaffold3255_cov191-Ochromonas_danica.AAC.7
MSQRGMIPTSNIDFLVENKIITPGKAVQLYESANSIDPSICNYHKTIQQELYANYQVPIDAVTYAFNAQCVLDSKR